MFTIGITGGTGAGKTSALRSLKAFDALILDCDAIYHELLAGNEDLKKELANRFEGVLQAGSIDRKKLGQVVFNDPRALRDLSVITHRYIGEEIDFRVKQWAERGGQLVAVDAIALIESGRAQQCDVTVGIIAPRDVRAERIMKRDGISREQAVLRINAQQPDSFYRDNCDYILEGQYGTLEEFEEVCKAFFSKILTKHLTKS
ncbi:MAG: dephospho-CoA kinase [Oscillospiraceae bacterium]|nr:dephospho-CoA kinase [Oscillospiraceae bacterium]